LIGILPGGCSNQQSGREELQTHEYHQAREPWGGLFNTVLMALCLTLWLAGIVQAQVFPLTRHTTTMESLTVTNIEGGIPLARACPEPRLLNDSDLLGSASVLYPLQTKYLLWESRLADNLTPN
jgi:hypothetical protein